MRERIEDAAVSTLTEWLDGYWSDDRGPQLRVRTAGGGDDFAVFNVEECDQYPSGDVRQFRVTVSVEEIR
jgi:hypothetical protein